MDVNTRFCGMRNCFERPFGGLKGYILQFFIWQILFFSAGYSGFLIKGILKYKLIVIYNITRLHSGCMTEIDQRDFDVYLVDRNAANAQVDLYDTFLRSGLKSTFAAGPTYSY